MPTPIYVDHNATTRPSPEVVAAMTHCCTECWGNPSSLHQLGREAAPLLEKSRTQVAALLGGVRPSTIAFTSSGTEADNLALHGLCAGQPEKRHIITTQVEHSAVLRWCQAREKMGFSVTYLPVDAEGHIDLDALREAIRDDTACVAVMWANNETGVIFPITDIAACCAERGVPFHCDAVQAAGKVPIDCTTLPVTTLAISGHKIQGPKGIGALYIRRGTPFRPMIYGGGQEYGRRAGTENVPHIAGLGIAAQQAGTHLGHLGTTTAAQRDRLEAALIKQISGSKINGCQKHRVPNTTNLSIPHVDGEGLILALSQVGVMASTGSACAAGSIEPSHVLKAMRLSREALQGTLRLSLSRETTDAEIDQLMAIIPEVVAKRRSLGTPKRRAM